MITWIMTNATLKNLKPLTNGDKLLNEIDNYKMDIGVCPECNSSNVYEEYVQDDPTMKSFLFVIIAVIQQQHDN